MTGVGAGAFANGFMAGYKTVSDAMDKKKKRELEQEKLRNDALEKNRNRAMETTKYMTDVVNDVGDRMVKANDADVTMEEHNANIAAMNKTIQSTADLINAKNSDGSYLLDDATRNQMTTMSQGLGQRDTYETFSIKDKDGKAHDIALPSGARAIESELIVTKDGRVGQMQRGEDGELSPDNVMIFPSDVQREFKPADSSDTDYLMIMNPETGKQMNVPEDKANQWFDKGWVKYEKASDGSISKEQYRALVKSGKIDPEVTTYDDWKKTQERKPEVREKVTGRQLRGNAMKLGASMVKGTYDPEQYTEDNLLEMEEAVKSKWKGTKNEEKWSTFQNEGLSLEKAKELRNRLQASIDDGTFKSGLLDTTLTKLATYTPSEIRELAGLSTDELVKRLEITDEASQMVSKVLKDISGTAASEKEFRRISNYMFGSEFQDETTFLGRMNSTVDRMERDYNREKTQWLNKGMVYSLREKPSVKETQVKTWSDDNFEYRKLEDGTVQKRKKRK